MVHFSTHIRQGRAFREPPARQGGFQGPTDAIDDRLRRAGRYHNAEPRRHLGFGKALLRQGRYIGKVFRPGDDASEDIGHAPRRIGIDDTHIAIGETDLRPGNTGQGKRKQPCSRDRADVSCLDLRVLPYGPPISNTSPS